MKQTFRKRIEIAAAITVAAAFSGSPARAVFINGDFVAVHVLSAGAANGADVAASVVLDDYGVNGSGAYVLRASYAINPALLTLSSDATQHEGAIHLSADGNYLTLGGYRNAAGSTATNTYSATAASVNRVVGLVNSSFSVDASTVLTGAYNTTSITGVATTDGTQFWTSGGNTPNTAALYNTPATGGLQYIAYGSTTPTNVSKTTTYPNSTAATVAQPDDLRNVKLVNGQVYVMSASDSAFPNNGTTAGKGLYATAAAEPTASTSDTAVITFNTGSGASSDKFVPKSDAVFLDLNGDGVIDTIYSSGGKSDLEKFTKTGNTWTEKYENKSFFAGDIYGLDGAVVNGVARLFATTVNSIYTFTDSAILNQTSLSGLSSINTLAGTDQYRGLAVLVVPEPATLAALGLAGLTLLRRRRS